MNALPDPRIPYISYVDYKGTLNTDAFQWALAPAIYWATLALPPLEKRCKPVIAHVLVTPYRNKAGYWDRELRLTFTQAGQIIARFH